MKAVILGIHGLHNKPSRWLLQKWWKKSIQEGLSGVTKKNHSFRFILVYWADFLYSRPLNRRIKDINNPLYINEPYISSSSGIQTKSNFFRKMGLYLADMTANLLFLKGKIDTPANKLWDAIIRRFFRDLDIYYFKYIRWKRRKRVPGKLILREKLRKTLLKYKKRKILLIAHSMGSIIAYDVLSSLPPHCKIHTLITIGSPLGFPAIKSKIRLEHQARNKKDMDLQVPDVIEEAWFNFSDLRDKVALDYRLKDDFKSNKLGIRAKDVPVQNDYEMEGKNNPHKSFGYLRTPELAQVIHTFLSGENYPIDLESG